MHFQAGILLYYSKALLFFSTCIGQVVFERVFVFQGQSDWLAHHCQTGEQHKKVLSRTVAHLLSLVALFLVSTFSCGMRSDDRPACLPAYHILLQHHIVFPQLGGNRATAAVRLWLRVEQGRIGICHSLLTLSRR